MGYSVITTVLSAAGSYNLTDLATVKDELSITPTNTADDAWLGRAIGRVSRAIASYTKRVLVPEAVQDAFDVEQDPYPYQTPGGFRQLQLTRWPVLAIQSVVQTLAVGTTQALTAGVDYQVNMATGQLLRLNPFTGVGTLWEAIPVTVQYVAGYGAFATEGDTIPTVAPYQITVSGAATFSCNQSVIYAGGAPLSPVPANPASGQYVVNASTGVYTFAAADAGRAVSVAYATAAIPDDLTGISLQLIAGRFRQKGRDPALIQRETPGVGTERWWFGAAPGQSGMFPPDIEGALDFYADKVVV